MREPRRRGRERRGAGTRIRRRTGRAQGRRSARVRRPRRSCSELLEEQLGIENVEQKLALAVRKELSLEQLCHFLRDQVFVHRAVLLEQERSRLAVEQIENWSVEADLAPRVEYAVGDDS